MRYTDIPKNKRNDVITVHIVENTEKVTHFYEVVGLNKKQSLAAVENDGYYDGDENDDNWVNIERMDGHSEYGDYTKPKITQTKHYIPCSNHGEVLDKKQHNDSGLDFMLKHRCYNLMLIPKNVLDESGKKYVPTNQIAWIRANPICRNCQRKMKAGFTLRQEVAE